MSSLRELRGTTGTTVPLVAMWSGTLVAATLVLLGVVVLITQGMGTVARSPVLDQAAGAASEVDHGTFEGLEDPGDEAAVQVDSRHLGGLELEIRASVSLNEPRRALGQAEVFAYTDMIQMPGAHLQGPVPLEEVEPGVYAGNVRLSMPGDYDVRVEVREPVGGAGTDTVAVGTVPG